MPFISPEDGYLTVFNVFETDTPEGQDGLLKAMTDIIDGATYPGWISSTLHSGLKALGTANYIQWRSEADLQARYAGQKFKKQTVPLFNELATSVNLIKTEVVFSQHHPSLGEVIEISPDRDDYTTILILGVEPENQKEMADTFGQRDEWLMAFPGYRSHSIFRSIDSSFVINYAQWDSKETYDRFFNFPEDERPADIQRMRSKVMSLATSVQSNSYRVVHTRSAKADSEDQ